MTREKTRSMIGIMQSFANGENIQRLEHVSYNEETGVAVSEKWIDCDDPDFSNGTFRIAPKPDAVSCCYANGKIYIARHEAITVINEKTNCVEAVISNPAHETFLKDSIEKFLKENYGFIKGNDNVK